MKVKFMLSLGWLLSSYGTHAQILRFEEALQRSIDRYHTIQSKKY